MAAGKRVNNKGTGRRKIEIKRIESESSRRTSFSKMKASLKKKVDEFKRLTGATVALIMFSQAKKPFFHGDIEAVGLALNTLSVDKKGLCGSDLKEGLRGSDLNGSGGDQCGSWNLAVGSSDDYDYPNGFDTEEFSRFLLESDRGNLSSSLE